MFINYCLNLLAPQVQLNKINANSKRYMCSGEVQKQQTKFGENKLFKSHVLNKQCTLTCNTARYSPKDSI